MPFLLHSGHILEQLFGSSQTHLLCSLSGSALASLPHLLWVLPLSGCLLEVGLGSAEHLFIQRANQLEQ